MKPNKLERYLEIVHTEGVGKTLKCFHRKPNELNKQKQAPAKIAIVTPKPLLV
jgi:hypothetical protein